MITFNEFISHPKAKMIPLLTPSVRLRVRKKGSKIMISIKQVICASILILSLVIEGQAQEISDKIDFETYNAQLLNNIEESPTQNVDDRLTSSSQEEIIGQSVISTTSSAISYDEENLHVDDFTSSSSFKDQPAPRPRSDRTSQNSWSLNEDVPLNDPELGAVFPQFAEAYNQEEAQQQADLVDLEFVEDSDFAILNEDGSVESYGTAEDLDQVVYYDQYGGGGPQYDYQYQDQGAGEFQGEFYEDYTTDEVADKSFSGDNNFQDLVGQGINTGGGPTTLMLFNIFTPDEVDFLETLVGEDALKELKDDVDVDLPSDVKPEQLRQTLEFSKPALASRQKQQSRRPPTFDDLPKNAYPSSQGIVRPDLNIRESLEVYDKSEYQHSHQADDLEEEGKEDRIINDPTDHVDSNPKNHENNRYLLANSDARREKMEALLDKLSERYENKKKDEEIIISSQDAILEEEIKETEKQTDRMKVMIDNLKSKLANSRPGVNSIDMKALIADQPIPIVEKEDNTKKLYHTTARPIGIDQVSEMIGEKIRDNFSVGMNRLNLDEILDLDMINIKSKGEASNNYPIPPPGSQNNENNNPNGSVDIVNKRQIIHPKLKRKRPTPQKAHLPSINLKAIITPATDAPNPAALEYKERPIIPRYVDQYIPPQPNVPPPQAPHEQYQPYAYTPYESNLQVKELPKKMGPRLQGYKPNKNPNVKELPPIAPIYDQPIGPPVPEHSSKNIMPNKADQYPSEKRDSLHPTLFYSETHVPNNFNPKTGLIKHFDEPHALPLEQEFENSDKYIPSDSYRKPVAPLNTEEFQKDEVDQNTMMKEDEEEEEQKRASKEYAPATYTRYPPPSYDYKQPNIRFDETPTKAPYIQVTPKNIPKSTTITHHSNSAYSYSTTTTTPSPHTIKAKELPALSYAPPPYRPPTYGSTALPPEVKSYGISNPKAEHVSSLAAPTRGYIVPPAPVGPGTTVAPPPKPYHSPRPTYMSTIYPPRTGYVPPSSGNYISTLSPPSHGYSTPAPPHVSSISPPKKSYLPPKKSSYLPVPPPTTKYSTPKPTYVSSISPPVRGYTTPKYFSTMAPPTKQNHYNKPIEDHLSHLKGPKKEYHQPMESYMTTMQPPKEHHHYEDEIRHHLSTMKPPKHGYDSKEFNSHISTIKPPVHYYENPMYEKLTQMKPPHPKDKYLPPPPDPKMIKLTPPVGDHYSGIQPNYKLQTMSPPQSSYDEGMKNIMAKLTPPEQEYLEHAMSVKSYLPPGKEYQSPKSVKGHHHHEHHDGKTHDYMDFVAKQFLEMKPPTSSYEIPHSTKMKPPSSSYEKPISDYLTTLHLPRQGYLPPDEQDHSHHHSADKPSGYKESVVDYMTSMHAPEKGYLPPKPNKIHPPSIKYEDPVSDYLASMHAPEKGYLPPKPSPTPTPHGHSHGPGGGFLPELASYLSPIQEYMASLLPPSKENGYVPPPPSTEYLTPLKEHKGEKFHPPTREYLTPFKGSSLAGRPSSQYGAPKQPKLLPVGPPPPPLKPAPILPSVCPPIRPGVKCEYVQNTCWSVGVPDVDCPGHGLCCFDGCANHCLRPSSLLPYQPYHVPPNKHYLVPGKEYLYLEALASKRRKADVDDSHNAYLNPSFMYSLASLPEFDELKSLPDLPTVNKLPRQKPSMLTPPTKYKPPAKNYLVPEPNKEYIAPVDGYELPSYSGKEVYEAKRPSVKDLPPIADYKYAHLQEELHPPGHEYLPPPKISKYTPPSENYKLPKELHHLVPPNEYLPPPDKMIKYKPPYEDYHPPKYMQEMGPPTKDYKPPGTITQFHPPASDYHAPKDMVEYRPPSKNYVPPPDHFLDHHGHSTTTVMPVHFSRGALDSPFMTPSKEYVPPPGLSKVPMKPPSEGYAVPKEAQFQPPSKEYLPPPPHPSELPPDIDINPHDQHHVPMTPPDQEYVSPKSGKKLVVDGVHFQLPTEEYLPPNQHKEHRVVVGDHGLLIPPVKEYIPPHGAATDHHQAGGIVVHHHENNGGKLIPPSKEYLEPDYYNNNNHHQKPHHEQPPHAKYHPPTQEYHAPNPQNGLAFAPPSKEYHAPIDYKVKELPHHGPTLVPPSKEYLPPPSNSIEGIGHAIHVNEHHQHHVTVPPTFLPPHEVVGHKLPEGSIAPTFLPPHDKHVLDHHGHHGDGTVAPTFLPPHDNGVPHITASLKNQDHHHHGPQAHVTSVTKDGPHSINIQIHMEPHHPGEGDHFPKFTSPLFRTSKPPKTGLLSKDHHPHADHGDVKPQYESKEVHPHKLPHGPKYEEEIHDGVAKPGYKDSGPSHHGPPPSLPQYVPPPISTHADRYAYKPGEHGLPPREYMPIGVSLHPKQYLPTNPLAYLSSSRYRYHEDLKRPTVVIPPKEVDPMRTLKPPFSDFRPPSEINAPVKAEGYIPPPPEVANAGGLVGELGPAEPTGAFVPPNKDYLPPRILPELVTDDPEIPVPPLPEELPLDIDDGLPSRGPQSPLNLKKEYVEPPPREVLSNSQIAPPVAKDKDPYIPPKTKFDVPKNFVRLEDADFDPDNQVELDFGTIDVLDAEQLPAPPSPDFVPGQIGEAEDLTEQPFLGLAKLQSASLKQGQSLKELEQLRDEVKKLAKLIEKPEKEGPKLPPMPTIPTLTSLTQTGSLPPQPSSFVPFLEKLQPSVLQQLQANIRNSNNQQGGKIPGKPGVDYPDFKTIPATDFTCENFILEGFYADTFTSCQVFHVCESGKRQSSFLCPRGTIFNQKHRVCDWWYNVKCEDSTEFYDLNLDLLLLEKGVSPTQASNLNIPPPIDPLASFGSLPLDLLGGSDAELDSLILDDLVLSNLLSGNNRRMDNSDSENNSMDLDQLLGATNSPISNRLPSAVAAPVQPQPTRPRKRKRKRRPSKRKSSSSGGGGGGGGSLCQIMNICDSIPAPPPSSFNRNQYDLMSAPSEFSPSIVPAPKSLRMDEKSAAEIAALYNQVASDSDLPPRRSHQIEDSIPAASSYSNSLSIPQVSISLPNFETSHSGSPSESLEYDQEVADNTNIDIPEEYRMTHFGKDVLTLKNHSNVPVTFINFDDFEERRSKMIPDNSPASEQQLQNVEQNSATTKYRPLTTTTEKSFKLKSNSNNMTTEFKLKNYNVDQDARTWSPMRMTENGKIERTDLSKPLDQSDWIPKLGPDTNIRET